MSGATVDGFAFARSASQSHTRFAESELLRARDQSVTEPNGAVEVSLTGSRDAEGRPRLSLVAKGVLHLQCQRCLQVMEWVVDINSSFRLVARESEIDDEDLTSDVEVIVGSSAMSVLDLVEDEIILGLPMVPMHERCEYPGQEAS